MPKSGPTFDPSAYAPVAERITLFYRTYPTGRITTELVSHADRVVTFRAMVFREHMDVAPAATGWAQEREGDGEINTVACLENTETSAIGRALANLGFTASINRPSREEMEKAQRARRRGLSVHARRDAVDMELAAEAVSDVLHLLNAARAAGFPSIRGEIISSFVNRLPPCPPHRLRRVEARIRDWVRRHIAQ
jgi:hypothetical protein